uniref:Uncharacterized protein n=1 Tax=Hyaloperonospora arabidopsidis (strain Emoy2) TaxID=559515 RepID=M4C2Q9_HYAAE
MREMPYRLQKIQRTFCVSAARGDRECDWKRWRHRAVTQPQEQLVGLLYHHKKVALMSH